MFFGLKSTSCIQTMDMYKQWTWTNMYMCMNLQLWQCMLNSGYINGLLHVSVIKFCYRYMYVRVIHCNWMTAIFYKCALYNLLHREPSWYALAAHQAIFFCSRQDQTWYMYATKLHVGIYHTSTQFRTSDHDIVSDIRSVIVLNFAG